MIRSLIISDLHLDPHDPDRYAAVKSGVSQVACDQLVLAGDIFEAWIGEDGARDEDIALLEFFGAHSDNTVLIAGNRDFLLSEQWLATFQIQLKPMLQLPGALIIHGDELCTLDHAYQTFKAEVRNPQWQTEFLAKPLAERQAIAQGLRQASRENQANRPESIGDAVDSTVALWMHDYVVDLLIHGHTHRPAVHFNPNGIRAVTSDWNDSGIGYVLDHDAPKQRTLSQVYIAPDAIEVREQWCYTAGTPEWKRNSVSCDWIN